MTNQRLETIVPPFLQQDILLQISFVYFEIEVYVYCFSSRLSSEFQLEACLVSTYLLVSLSTNILIILFTNLLACLPICLSACLSICLSACLPMYLPVCLPESESFVFQSARQFFFCQHVH